MAMAHPIVQDVPGVRESVRFMKRSALEELPVPWPRCQDLPSSSFSEPEKDDFVIAVSHAWAYQAHPDPLGEKRGVLREQTELACAAHKLTGRMLFFVDFLSTAQRPFARGQAPRTPEQDDAFATALKAFPFIYLMADATFHVEVETSDVPEDMHDYTVEARELLGVPLQVVGPTVQVVDFGGSASSVAPFDFVTSIGSSQVKKVEDVDRFRNAPAPVGQRSTPWLCWQPCAHGPHTAHVRRAPYGRRNALPASVKGWIFLERFVSMVKAAMVPASHAAGVAFSNSQDVLDEIFRGGARLRAAAAGGKEELQATLQEFAKELDSKQFSATSMDKVMDTGGVGGMQPGGAGALRAVNASAYSASDRDVVWELMQVLVQHLLLHWEVEAAAQRQRQLMLAVCRGNTADVSQLIEARADPNAPDAAGRTALHAAASFHQVDMVRTLLEHGASTTAEDALGNMPIHLLSILPQDDTVQLIYLLAPSKLELAKANVAGISPLKKLATFVDITGRDTPVVPLVRCLERLRALYPEVLLMKTPGVVTLAELSRTPAVKRLERYEVGDRSVVIPVWEAPRGKAAVHVLFLALQWVLPWSLTETAASLLADCVCDRFDAKLWVVTPEALDAAVLAEERPLSKLHDDLVAVVNALPLGERFFLLDSSWGMAVPLIWRIPDRLHGALVVNPCNFFSEEFEGSKVHATFAKAFQEQLLLAKARDPERQASMHSRWSTAVRYEDLAGRCAEYKKAWRAAPGSYWLWWAYVNLDIVALSRMFWTLPPLPALPVTFAVGSLASATLCAEPVMRFQKILPNSKVAYIPDSRMLWDFEGEEPMCKVASVLCELMADSLGRLEEEFIGMTI